MGVRFSCDRSFSGTAAVSRLQRLCNHAVRVTCGLRNYDHVSATRHNLAWMVTI